MFDFLHSLPLLQKAGTFPWRWSIVCCDTTWNFHVHNSLHRVLLLARLMGQYCFVRWRLSSSLTLPAGGPGARAAERPTLHGGPVVLRPVSATVDTLFSMLHMLLRQDADLLTPYRFLNMTDGGRTWHVQHLAVVMVQCSCLHFDFTVQLIDDHVILCCCNIIDKCDTQEMGITGTVSHLLCNWVVEQLLFSLESLYSVKMMKCRHEARRVEM